MSVDVRTRMDGPVELIEQLVECNRIITHANAGRIVNGIGNRRADAANAKLANAFGFHW